MPDLQRREFIVQGSAALAGMAGLYASHPAHAFPMREGEEVVPWIDQPTDPVRVGIQNQLVWEDMDTWITPNDKFFSISHFNRPMIDEKTWSLEIWGNLACGKKMSLAYIKEQPRQEVVFTLECSGNHGFPFFTGGIGNARWAGTPLAPLLQRVGLLDDVVEVVFFGADKGEVVNRGIKMQQNFARSMSLAEAMNPDNLLCYEMNGAPLPPAHGSPLRLIAPGWYGIASVKWLKAIELRDSRFMNLMMARNYVTIREEEHNGETVWTETSVGRSLIKSAPAKVTRKGSAYRIIGAAWGTPIKQVDVKIDRAPWTSAIIDRSEEADHAWKIWFLDWENPSPGEHTVTSRALGPRGQVQPAMDDPSIAKKHTYWENNGQVTRRIRIV